jgi:hypothetical protein
MVYPIFWIQTLCFFLVFIAMDAVWQAFQNTVGGDATLSRAEMEGASPWF